ncbi:MAG: SDR family NAD(P)-dependent oxidoreductase [Candidatus Hydrogenedentota bacterium]|nr:MAG: SDR family NAD(P)-dependent oxidoreductase [Candidatus Hydrogenedentota bacterium]
MDFQNQRILITGGSKGIGKAISLELVKRGASICVLARDKKALEQLQQEAGKEKVSIASVDITDKKKLKSTIEKLGKESPFHGIICCAGFARPGKFEELPEDSFKQMMDVDYFGTVYTIRYALPFIQDQSWISLVSSVVGYMGVYGYTAYAGAKFALIGFAESLQQELYEKNISVSVLCPPDTNTPGYEQENKTKPYVTQKLSESAKLMTPEEVAKKYLKKLKKGKFLITVNFESTLFYRLKGCMPGFVRFVMKKMIQSALKKIKAS